MSDRKPDALDILGEDSNLKFCFDHLRNIGICAALTAAAFWLVDQGHTHWLLRAFIAWCATTIWLISIVLYAANGWNFVQRIAPRSPETGRLDVAKAPILYFYLVIYTAVMGVLQYAIAHRA